MPAHTKGVLIKQGNAKDGSVLMGRDVEFELRSVDVHPTVKSLLIRLAEINYVNMKGIAELAMLMDRLATGYQDIVAVASNMKEQTDKFNTFLGGVDVPDDTTTN